jgi:hypothetical protein
MHQGRQALIEQQTALQAMLGVADRPVWLDIKPVEWLTADERRRFTDRLAAVTAALEEAGIAETPKACRQWSPD